MVEADIQRVKAALEQLVLRSADYNGDTYHGAYHGEAQTEVTISDDRQSIYIGTGDEFYGISISIDSLLRIIK